MSKTYDFIKECGPFFAATVLSADLDQLPAVRPFGAMMEYRDALYFATSNMKSVYSQLMANPNIQIVSLNGGTKQWIRISGKAEEVFDDDTKQAMLTACPPLIKNFPSKECPQFAVFKIAEMEAYLYGGEGVCKLD